MKYILVFLSIFALSGCDKIYSIPINAAKKILQDEIDVLNLQNQELKAIIQKSGNKIKIADNFERDAKILKSLISNKKEDQL